MTSETENPLPLIAPSFWRYWLPPVLWMGMIFIFSTDLLAAGQTGGTLRRILLWLKPDISDQTIDMTHFLVRKASHFMEYAILALLLHRAFRADATLLWQMQWALRSFGIVAIYALLDEYHQTFTQFRSGSIYDSFIDMAGGATALICLWMYERLR